jgi:IS5 family transposase
VDVALHFLQYWFNLSDPAVEDALYDSIATRRFVGIYPGREPVPDETPYASFAICWESITWSINCIVLINESLQEDGLRVSTGTIVDATIIDVLSSTKDKARDPQMHPSKKDNQCCFGMNAHIGVNSRPELLHSVLATAAIIHYSHMLGGMLHGKEKREWGGCADQGGTIREHVPGAKDFTHQKRGFHSPLSDQDKAYNRTKSTVRAKAEHPFLILKRVFGFTKVGYRGLDKNAARLFVACGLVNLCMMGPRLLRAT